MTIGLSPLKSKIRRGATVLLAAAMAILPTGAALADAGGPYYDRSFILAAHERCRLFTPAVTSALTAATFQARGAALRGGASDPDLAATAQRARARAARTSCRDPQLGLVQQRVAHAFAGWSRMPRMTFQGPSNRWQADRTHYSTLGWRLMQASRAGDSPVTFGMSSGGGRPEQLSAVVSFVGQPRPYAVRIVMRDIDRSARPWLTRDGKGRLPPATSQKAFFSGGSAMADRVLLAADRKQGQAWVFPTAAADALGRLDPREPFVIEFLFRDDSVARATFEAGDFAAGRAFIAMGSL